MKPASLILAIVGWSVAASASTKQVRGVGDMFEVDVESGDTWTVVIKEQTKDPTDYTSDEIAELPSNFEDAVNGASDSDVTARGIYVDAEGNQIELRLATLAPVTIGTYDRRDFYDAADELLKDFDSLDEGYPSFVSADASSNNDARDVGIYEFEYTPTTA